jgi:MFS family permease
MEDDNYEGENDLPTAEEQLVPTSEVEESSTTDMLPPVPSKCRRLSYIMMLTLFSGIGSFLFGYGTGVVSGAMIKVDKVFSLTYLWHELIVSVTVGAAAVAALIGGPLSDFLGRRMVLIVSSVIFTLGAVLLAASVAKEMLLVGRLVVGVGIGELSGCAELAKHLCMELEGFMHLSDWVGLYSKTSL